MQSALVSRTIVATKGDIMDLQALLKSKRFWAAVASIAVVVLKDKVPLTEDQISLVVLAIGGWIVGESIRPVNAPEVSK